MRKFFRKYYLKLKSLIVSTITKEKITYLDGRDIPPLITIIFFDGGEEHW